MASQPCILVAVDFSATSMVALQTAARVAQDAGAKVVLVHAFSPPLRAPTLAATLREDAYVPLLEAAAEMAFDEVQDLTERWAKPLRDQGLDVEVVASAGRADELILEVAAQHDPFMIVMGRQGHRKLRRMIIGSMTQHVTQKSRWPVLIVPILD